MKAKKKKGFWSALTHSSGISSLGVWSGVAECNRLIDRCDRRLDAIEKKYAREKEESRRGYGETKGEKSWRFLKVQLEPLVDQLHMLKAYLYFIGEMFFRVVLIIIFNVIALFLFILMLPTIADLLF